MTTGPKDRILVRELDVFRSVIARLAYHRFHAYFLQFVYSLFPVHSNIIYINKSVSQSVNRPLSCHQFAQNGQKLTQQKRKLNHNRMS